MKPRDEQLLRKHWATLCAYLEPVHFVPYLVQENVLDDFATEHIYQAETRKAQIDRMLDVLSRVDPFFQPMKHFMICLQSRYPTLLADLIGNQKLQKRNAEEWICSAHVKRCGIAVENSEFYSLNEVSETVGCDETDSAVLMCPHTKAVEHPVKKRMRDSFDHLSPECGEEASSTAVIPNREQCHLTVEFGHRKRNIFQRSISAPQSYSRFVSPVEAPMNSIVFDDKLMTKATVTCSAIMLKCSWDQLHNVFDTLLVSYHNNPDVTCLINLKKLLAASVRGSPGTDYTSLLKKCEDIAIDARQSRNPQYFLMELHLRKAWSAMQAGYITEARGYADIANEYLRSLVPCHETCLALLDLGTFTLHVNKRGNGLCLESATEVHRFYAEAVNHSRWAEDNGRPVPDSSRRLTYLHLCNALLNYPMNTVSSERPEYGPRDQRKLKAASSMLRKIKEELFQDIGDRDRANYGKLLSALTLETASADPVIV